MRIYYMPYGTTQEEINKLRKSINKKIIIIISGNDDFKTNLKDFIVAAKKQLLFYCVCIITML